jgi:hypothetical protein
MSSARLLLLLLDHLLGATGPWRRARRKGLLLVQRGWFDMVVDPDRYGLSRSAARFAAILGRFVPRADLVVLLGGSPSVIKARKAELSVEEISRQLTAWPRYLPGCAHMRLELDTTLQSPDQLAGVIWTTLRGEAP